MVMISDGHIWRIKGAFIKHQGREGTLLFREF